MQRVYLAAILCMALACNNNTPSATTNAADSPAVATPQNAPATMATIPDAQDTAALSGQWYLQPVLPSDTATGHIPAIQFDLATHRFSGTTGCNRMSGSFMLTDTSLTFNKNMMTTKMACIGYNEQAFIDNLLRTNRFTIKDSVLILLFDVTELSRWTRKVQAPQKTNKA